MTINSSSTKSLILITAAVFLGFCGSVLAEKQAKPDKPEKEVKLPEFKDAEIKFDDDEKKFFVWLNTYLPDRADELKMLEKSPKEYQDNFRQQKSRFRRLWKGYKKNKKYGEALVVEVKLKWQRIATLEKLNKAKDQKDKDQLKAELNDIVSKEFDIAVKIKRIMYEGLKKKIKRLECHLAGREREVKKLVEHKDNEVKMRIEELLKGEEKIRWK